MFCVLVLLLLAVANAFAQPARTLLNDWTVRSEDGSIGPVAAPVPGVVHAALLQADIIPDPHFGDNEQRVAWVDSTTWIYETVISIPPLMQEPVLVFDGLDTLADIYIDGDFVLSADNMFRRWRVPLDPEIEAFDVRIVFHPAAVEAERIASVYPYPLPESPRMFVRKAAYHFGWDWGPRFVTAGPWKGVFLEDAAIPRLENVYVRTLRIDADNARVELTADLAGIGVGTAACIIRMNGVEIAGFQRIPTSPDGSIRLQFSVFEPQLWWPNGYGDPYLYDMEVVVYASGHRLRYNQRVGISTVELNQDDGAFTFVINGERIFVKGANSAPMTSFYPASEERYRTVLQAAADANMNMLRVWGGGVYEDDHFYDLADSLGIMVWQDFMFANALYPDTDEFLANVRQEATEQVIRLRRHPSIVLWCGNNEISEGWHNWGWQEALGYSEDDSIAVWKGYQRLFEELLPGVVRAHHEDVPYWPSSPSNGWGRDIAYEEGDVHYWGVWWGRAPFETYREKVGRFNSEYGFQAYPVERTVRTFADDLTEDSDAFRNHQKHPHGFEWLREYAEMTFGHVPEDPALWRYMTQVMQAEGVGMAIAAHRANKPRTMGTMYWQLNDVWPVISWSSMDVFGRWKPLHYRVRDLYQPLFAEVYQEGDSLRLRVVSDRRTSMYGEFMIEVHDTHSELLRWEEFALTIPFGGTVDTTLAARDEFEVPDDRLVFRTILFTSHYSKGYSWTSTLVPRWNLNLRDPELTVQASADFTWLTAKWPAFGVWIEDPAQGSQLQYNYVDVFPLGIGKLHLPNGLATDQLIFRSIYDLQRQ